MWLQIPIVLSSKYALLFGINFQLDANVRCATLPSDNYMKASTIDQQKLVDLTIEHFHVDITEELATALGVFAGRPHLYFDHYLMNVFKQMLETKPQDKSEM